MTPGESWHRQENPESQSVCEELHLSRCVLMFTDSDGKKAALRCPRRDGQRGVTLFEACGALLRELLDGGRGEYAQSFGVGSDLGAAHRQEVLQRSREERSLACMRLFVLCRDLVSSLRVSLSSSATLSFLFYFDF